MSEESKKKLLEQLDALKIFPNNNLVRQLRRDIQQKLEKLQKEKATVDVVEVFKKANQTRSRKVKQYHRYMRLIYDNARSTEPNIRYTDVRQQYSERKQGKEVSIPDVVWQNPSP